MKPTLTLLAAPLLIAFGVQAANLGPSRYRRAPRR